MIKQYKHNDITWIDAIAPTKEDLLEISEKFKIHPVAVNDLLIPSQRPKVDMYDNFIYAILHFPSSREFADKVDDEFGRPINEIDFIIGPDFLITVSYRPVQPLEEFGRIFEANSALGATKKSGQAMQLFFFVLQHLYRSLEDSLIQIDRDLLRAEKKVFAGQERAMVTVLSKINKQLLDFRWATKGHREILNSLSITCQELFGTKFDLFLKRSSAEYEKIWHMLEGTHELLHEIKSLNESLLGIQISETTKTFTLLAFITFPLSVLINIFAIKAQQTPFINHPYGFWIILAMAGTITLAMMTYFKHRRWL